VYALVSSVFIRLVASLEAYRFTHISLFNVLLVFSKYLSSWSSLVFSAASLSSSFSITNSLVRFLGIAPTTTSVFVCESAPT
jgi:hypothetical protein